jgi:hypothetical protein
MRFRAGLVTGFAAGYYLGAKAGRARYEQINRILRDVRRSPAFGAATDKARAVVDLGVERAKDIVDIRHPPEQEDIILLTDGQSNN